MPARTALIAAAALLAASESPTQFTSFRHDATYLLEGNWQSCRDPETRQYNERVFDQVQLGIEVHLGPGDDFAIFRGIQEEHREHRSPENLLQPPRAKAGRQRWELDQLIFEVAPAGGSRFDCRSYWITLQKK